MLATIPLMLLLTMNFTGCGGGGGGDGDVTPGAFLLFYGDNTNPDTSDDGLFKIQGGALSLVKAINPAGKSHVQGFTAYGDQTIFSACNVLAGCEPWITDGTTGGTYLLQDINPGNEDSSPFGYILFDDEVYFSADDGEHGIELWKTDGTEAGTVLVRNIAEETDPDTPIDSAPHELTVFNGALYFAASDGETGIELWKTDGTEAGTVLVRNIAEEADPDTPIDSAPHELTVFNGALYFAATDGETGIEPWKTDGTAANTLIVKNIAAALSANSSPEQFTIFSNALYFFADDGVRGFEPWKTNGTEAGTVIVANIGDDTGGRFPATTANLTFWTEAGGELIFTADDGATGIEPWRTDGTTTEILKDINPGIDGSVVSGREDVFRVFNGQLFFFADDGTHGFELWRSVPDVTGWETDLVKEIASVPANAPLTANGLKFLAEYHGQLYFTADDGRTGQEIWSTEGLGVDTSLLKDIGPGAESGYSEAFGPEILDGVLYFSAFDGGIGAGHGVEMWRTFGTGIETQLVADLNPGAQDDGVLKAAPLPLP
jgi:ELWxxDGT repeat protein